MSESEGVLEMLIKLVSIQSETIKNITTVIASLQERIAALEPAAEDEVCGRCDNTPTDYKLIDGVRYCDGPTECYELQLRPASQ